MTTPLKPEMPIFEAIARGWCHAENTAKPMDAELAGAIYEEVMKELEWNRRAEDAEPDQLTEEMLRKRQGGYLKVGKGCAIVTDTYIAETDAELARLREHLGEALSEMAEERAKCIRLREQVRIAREGLTRMREDPFLENTSDYKNIAEDTLKQMEEVK